MGEVNFKNIPPCANNSCFPFHASSIGCVEFTIDCFCNKALTPLSCAEKSCNGTDWFALEDWFDTICPSPPLVDFGTIPACSRTCIRTAIIPKYCPAFSDDTQTTAPKITRNCFCRLNETFTSLTSCLVNDCYLSEKDASSRLQEEYTHTCTYGSGVRPDSGGSNTGDEVVQNSNTSGNQGNGISGLEWFGIVIGIVASIITVFGAWRSFNRWRSRRRV